MIRIGKRSLLDPCGRKYLSRIAAKVCDQLANSSPSLSPDDFSQLGFPAATFPPRLSPKAN